MTLRTLLLLPLCLFLVACGPLYGQLTKLTDRVEVEVRSGDLKSLRGGGRLLVAGPFTKDKDAFYICRGEEAQTFATSLEKEKLFATEFLYRDDYETFGERLRGKNGTALRAELGLEEAPDLLLLGHIRHRSMDVVPFRGVLMPIGYTLEFIDFKTGGSTIVDIEVKDEFAKCIVVAVEALAEKINKAG